MDYKITVWAELVSKEENIEKVEPVSIIYRSTEAAAVSRKTAIEKILPPAIISENLNVYPNPSKAISSINFTAKQSGPATLKVYNAFGKEVATLFDGITEKGKQYQQIFNGHSLSSGIYLIRLHSGNGVSNQKLLLTK